MQKIDISKYGIRRKVKKNKQFVYDSIRKKYFILTPEEEVRQRYIKYLIQEKKYSIIQISVEMTFNLYKTLKRVDIVIYDAKQKPKIIVECKAPHISLDMQVLNQAMEYATILQPQYIVITNGLYQLTLMKNINGKYVKTEELPKN